MPRVSQVVRANVTGKKRGQAEDIQSDAPAVETPDVKETQLILGDGPPKTTRGTQILTAGDVYDEIRRRLAVRGHSWD